MAWVLSPAATDKPPILSADHLAVVRLNVHRTCQCSGLKPKAWSSNYWAWLKEHHHYKDPNLSYPPTTIAK